MEMDWESPYITPPLGSSDPMQHPLMIGRQCSQSVLYVFDGELQDGWNRTCPLIRESGHPSHFPNCYVHSCSPFIGQGIEVVAGTPDYRVWLRLRSVPLHQRGQDPVGVHSAIPELDPQVQASV